MLRVRRRIERLEEEIGPLTPDLPRTVTVQFVDPQKNVVDTLGAAIVARSERHRGEHAYEQSGEHPLGLYYRNRPPGNLRALWRAGRGVPLLAESWLVHETLGWRRSHRAGSQAQAWQNDDDYQWNAGR